MIHVPEHLSSTNADPVHPRIHGVGDVVEFESGREVGQEASAMSQVDELKGIFEPELFDDASARVFLFLLFWF